MAIGPLQSSGRVIAGGRLLLACLFLVAIWADSSQPTRGPVYTYVLLTAYVLWSLTVAILVWKDWWYDARLAAPAHVIDVAVFMVMLFSTEGYTSPYFTFFIFILLAAAIRWGWRETAVTAVVIIATYFATGLTFGPSPEVEVERFIIRTGHLFIISAILMWFGANQWAGSPRVGLSAEPSAPVGGDPFIAALEAGMAAIGAGRGILLWREAVDEEIGVVRASSKGATRAVLARTTAVPQLPSSLLFDLTLNRVLMRAEAGRWLFLRAEETLPPGLRKQLEDDEGLAVPITTTTAEGYAVFQDVRALSTDHLDLAPRLARDMAVRLQEAELFAAVEERSVGRARVAVARDLHDNIVQFLAGLSFRLEALKRAPAAHGELADAIADLKDTVMAEQRHLRAFIRGLRSGRAVSLGDLSRDCASLCHLLGRQWNIDCNFTLEAGSGVVPMRMQLDIQQLVREAVANAVRHGDATRVAVTLRGEPDRLCLTIADNGHGFAVASGAGDEVPAPASLSTRVREAGGKLEVNSAPGATLIAIRLPVALAA